MKSFIKIQVIVGLTLLFCSNLLSAQDKNNPWQIGVGLNAVDYFPVNIPGMKSETGAPTKWYDQFFNLNEHYNYIVAPSKLSVGRYLNENFNFDLSLSVNKISKFGSIKLEKSISYFSVDGNLNYDINQLIGDTKWFNPYAIIGAGFTAQKGYSQNNLYFKNYGSFNSGLGAKIWLNQSFGIKGQTVYKHFFNNGSYPHFQHSISLIYKFGKKDQDNDGISDKDDKCPNVWGLKQFNGCPDSDEDGIPDSEDACPTVYGSIALNGCPDADNDGIPDFKDKCPYLKGVASADGCPDADGDGITDQDDACPDQAGPKSNNGCPELDTDKDGILDKNDKCPTLAGPVSNNGCPVSDVNLEKKLNELATSILFISGTDQYYPKFKKELDEIADLMKQYTNTKFEIQGYTDSYGSTNSNLKLSLNRVNAILNYLVSNGVNKLNLRVKGFGEEFPIATNDTPEGRAKNRRVEIKVVK